MNPVIWWMENYQQGKILGGGDGFFALKNKFITESMQRASEGYVVAWVALDLHNRVVRRTILFF